MLSSKKRFLHLCFLLDKNKIEENKNAKNKNPKPKK